jgi:hypothetical protein
LRNDGWVEVAICRVGPVHNVESLHEVPALHRRGWELRPER